MGELFSHDLPKHLVDEIDLKYCPEEIREEFKKAPLPKRPTAPERQRSPKPQGTTPSVRIPELQLPAESRKLSPRKGERRSSDPRNVRHGPVSGTRNRSSSTPRSVHSPKPCAKKTQANLMPPARQERSHSVGSPRKLSVPEERKRSASVGTETIGRFTLHPI